MEIFDIFHKNNLPVSWCTLLTGLQLKCISTKEVSIFASSFLSRYPKTNDDQIIELAWDRDSSAEAETILENMINHSGIVCNGQLEKRKWIFCLLNHLRESEMNDEILLEKAADLYVVMDYPEEMEEFIYYLPPKDGYDPSVYSKKQNHKRLIDKMADFLTQEINHI